MFPVFGAVELICTKPALFSKINLEPAATVIPSVIVKVFPDGMVNDAPLEIVREYAAKLVIEQVVIKTTFFVLVGVPLDQVP